MNKLVLEVEGSESTLRTIFEIVEKIALGVATIGSLSIKKAVIETPVGRIVLDPAYAGDSKPESRLLHTSDDGMGG